MRLPDWRWLRRHGRARAAPPHVPECSVAAQWLDRAARAVLGLDDLARAAPHGPLRLQVGGAAGRAADSLGALARLAAQVTAAEQALRHVHSPGLDAEAARLSAAADQAPPAVREELARSAAALRDRQAVRSRLLDARTTLLARMQSATLGLEGLVARLAEVLALAEATGAVEDSAGRVASLAAELDGLRAGLVEVEELSRAALASPLPPDAGR